MERHHKSVQVSSFARILGCPYPRGVYKPRQAASFHPPLRTPACAGHLLRLRLRRSPASAFVLHGGCHSFRPRPPAPLIARVDKPLRVYRPPSGLVPPATPPTLLRSASEPAMQAQRLRFVGWAPRRVSLSPPPTARPFNSKSW